MADINLSLARIFQDMSSVYQYMGGEERFRALAYLKASRVINGLQAAVKIRKLADEFICIDTPEDFMAVGQFYYDFSEVTDTDVIELLNEIKEFPKAA